MAEEDEGRGGEKGGDGDKGGGEKGGGDEGVKSYAGRLMVNVKRGSRLRRNVLEINLENENGGYVKIESDTVARLLNKLGIDLSIHTEGVQTCPGSSNKIFVWL